MEYLINIYLDSDTYFFPGTTMEDGHVHYICYLSENKFLECFHYYNETAKNPRYSYSIRAGEEEFALFLLKYAS